MFRRFFKPAATGLTAAFAGSLVGVGTYLYQQASAQVQWMDGNSYDYSPLGISNTGKQLTAADIQRLSQDQAFLRAHADYLESLKEGKTIASTNWGDGHVYSFKASTRVLTNPEQALALASNMARVVVGMFPNRGKELPPELAAAIEAQYGIQLEGKARAIELIQGANTLEYRQQKWQENNPIDATVALGWYSYVRMNNHTIIHDGDRVIMSLLATTTRQHLFEGSAIWMVVINTKTMEVNFGVLGAGQHPYLRSIDGLNNLLVGPLWEAQAEAFVGFLNHFGEQLLQRPDLINRTLDDPQLLREALNKFLPNESQRRRTFLEVADSASVIAVAVGGLFSSVLETITNPPPPPADQQKAISDMLDVIGPNDQLLTEDDLQQIYFEEQNDANNSSDGTGNEGETGSPDDTSTEGGTGIPTSREASSPDDTGLPDGTGTEEETNSPDGIGTEGETGIHEGVGAHTSGETGHGE
ncbi:MAG TPA: hypothetical protein DHW02_00850 [Ktedonobacter sp.]|nr:hypothetical protein [Ktedonobacter sp.]